MGAAGMGVGVGVGVSGADLDGALDGVALLALGEALHVDDVVRDGVARPASSDAANMVSEFGAASLESRRFLRWSEAPGPSSRVRRAASSLRMQSEEPVVARYGAAKTPQRRPLWPSCATC